MKTYRNIEMKIERVTKEDAEDQEAVRYGGGRDMYTTNREEEVKLLKRLWSSQPTLCPKCGGAELEHLHKKAKKSDCDWKCPACGEIYRTINMFKALPDE